MVIINDPEQLAALEQELEQLERDDPAVAAAARAYAEMALKITRPLTLPCGQCGRPVVRGERSGRINTRWQHKDRNHDCQWGYPLKPGVQIRVTERSTETT